MQLCLCVLQMRGEFTSQLDRAQGRVLQQEQLHQQMAMELSKLREALKQVGRDMPETKFEVSLGNGYRIEGASLGAPEGGATRKPHKHHDEVSSVPMEVTPCGRQ